MGIEQTTGGKKRVEGLLRYNAKALGFPVINVAESIAKLYGESGLIADSILTELEAHLRGLRPGFIMRKLDPLVIGYGTVGAYVCAALQRKGVYTRVYDVDNHKLSIAAAAGFHATPDFLGAIRNFRANHWLHRISVTAHECRGEASRRSCVGKRFVWKQRVQRLSGTLRSPLPLGVG